jgi:hypothetical protein
MSAVTGSLREPRTGRKHPAHLGGYALKVRQACLTLLAAVLDGDCGQHAYEILGQSADPHLVVHVAHQLAHDLADTIGAADRAKMRAGITAELRQFTGTTRKERIMNQDDQDHDDQADDGTGPVVVTIDGDIGSQPPAPGRQRWPMIGPPGGA